MSNQAAFATFVLLFSVALGFSALAELSPGSYIIASNASGGILNMRAGPGQGHPLVISIPAGSSGVIVTNCQAADDRRSRNDWCHATWNDHSGWVSSRCLVRDARAPADAAPTYTPTGQGVPQSCTSMRGSCKGRLCQPIREDAQKWGRKIAAWISRRDTTPDNWEQIERNTYNTFHLCQQVCEQTACAEGQSFKNLLMHAEDNLWARAGDAYTELPNWAGGRPSDRIESSQ